MRRMGRATAALAVVLGLAASAAAQQKSKNPAPKPPDEKEMLEAMEKAATPGEGQKRLEPFVGTFEARVRMFMDASKPPADSAGTSVSTWVLGNRYVEEKFEGTFMEQPFSGVGYTGYDNVSKKYVSTWMDTAGTGMMWSTGSVDASGKVMTWKGTVNAPLTDKPSPVNIKVEITDNDHHSMQMWGKGPNGKMVKVMEIQYTRKK